MVAPSPVTNAVRVTAGSWFLREAGPSAPTSKILEGDHPRLGRCTRFLSARPLLCLETDGLIGKIRKRDDLRSTLGGGRLRLLGAARGLSSPRCRVRAPRGGTVFFHELERAGGGHCCLRRRPDGVIDRRGRRLSRRGKEKRDRRAEAEGQGAGASPQQDASQTLAGSVAGDPPHSVAQLLYPAFVPDDEGRFRRALGPRLAAARRLLSLWGDDDGGAVLGRKTPNGALRRVADVVHHLATGSGGLPSVPLPSSGGPAAGVEWGHRAGTHWHIGVRAGVAV